MIVRGTTGNLDYPVMIIGKVVVTKDLGGGAGGAALAKIAVAAHPTSFAPLVSRAHFWRSPPGVGSGEGFEFRAGRRYVVIALHRNDGSFRSDGGCGQTRRVHAERFQTLIRLARQN